MDIKLRKGNLPTGLLPSYFTLVRREVMRIIKGPYPVILPLLEER